VLAEHPDTTLVITDVNMPVMGGFELISAIRRQYRREDLAIIGLSDASKAGLSAALLKAGANDFVAKPFQVEEFYCRVTQNTNMVGYVRQIKDFATRDFLTGAYNRRHLFEMGGKLYASAQRGNIAIATGVIDADHFKHINDTYGHHAGDAALKCIADVLQSSLRQTDVVAR
jgi:PleD family two-component response regulator